MNNPGSLRVPLGMALVPLLVLLTVMGWLASPSDAKGRPLLLLPDIKAVEEYRRLAITWVAELRLANVEVASVYAGDFVDLFDQTRRAQRALEEALWLVQEMDWSETPPAMAGLKEALSRAAQANLEAARWALRWLGSPNEENTQNTQQKLAEAESILEELESNRWLKPTSP